MTNSKLLTDSYRMAVDIAAELFRDINRQITGLPYIVHLISVSHIVAKVTDCEAAHIAALLHDVLEDIPEEVYSEADMRRDFGEQVTEIVKTVSHDEGRYGKAKAREVYLEQIRQGSVEACIVSAADLLSNTMDIVSEYTAQPEKVKTVFGGKSTERRQWFWQERYTILAKRLGNDHPIIKELEELLSKLWAIHSKIL